MAQEIALKILAVGVESWEAVIAVDESLDVAGNVSLPLWGTPSRLLMERR